MIRFKKDDQVLVAGLLGDGGLVAGIIVKADNRESHNRYMVYVQSLKQVFVVIPERVSAITRS